MMFGWYGAFLENYLSKQNVPSHHLLAVWMQGEGKSLFFFLGLVALCMVLVRRFKILLGEWISCTSLNDFGPFTHYSTYHISSGVSFGKSQYKHQANFQCLVHWNEFWSLLFSHFIQFWSLKKSLLRPFLGEKIRDDVPPLNTLLLCFHQISRI